MKSTFTAIALSSVIVLGACANLTPRQRNDLGAATAGAVVGGVAAAAIFNASAGWIVASSLAGAAAGVLIARNNKTGQCAYADGNGGYVTQQCR
ncbi:MAG: glucose-6-phosphate isomerase [Pseudomonadota bacterium]